jgi:hypothetical protein
MLRTTTIIWLLLCVAQVTAQEEKARYRLLPGETYFITQELIQETETDNIEFRNNASLTINSTIEFEVKRITPAGDYHFSCRYRDLSLSFFSPRSDLYINSQDQAFSQIKSYLRTLEKHRFGVEMSVFGEFRESDSLDSIINSLFREELPDSLQHDLIIRTLREAFGQNALVSLVNTAMNVYSDTLSEDGSKFAAIAFNARMLPVKNRFYYLAVDDAMLRIQGVGVIEETESIIEQQKGSIVTSMHGQQTYDHLFSRGTGWIRRGISKQRIYMLSTIRGHSELPDGLKIPSYTESEYVFRGGKRGEND